MGSKASVTTYTIVALCTSSHHHRLTSIPSIYLKDIQVAFDVYADEIDNMMQSDSDIYEVQIWQNDHMLLRQL